MKTAIFGGGCFWCTEAVFTSLEGVIQVTSGYTGGKVKNPTYKEVCSGETGHAEVVRVTYDEQVLPTREVLRTFWENHDPTQGMRQGNDVGTQYRSAIYTTTPEQLHAATASREVYQARLSAAGFGPITTEVASAPPFYYAEDYHQQYLAKNPNGLDALFTNADKGIAKRMDDYLKTWTSSVDGHIKRRQENTESVEKSLNKKELSLDAQYTRMYDRYLAQFTRVEQLQYQMEFTMNLIDNIPDFGGSKK